MSPPRDRPHCAQSIRSPPAGFSSREPPLIRYAALVIRIPIGAASAFSRKSTHKQWTIWG
ncbi:hypothetical protein BPC006_I0066 [Burkholderia pseudomallei BPC006]|nr:hypothetical protein BPC006_I0066 [Burkholderia pseudomallei BPC006]